MEYAHVRDSNDKPFATIAYQKHDDVYVACVSRCDRGQDVFTKVEGRLNSRVRVLAFMSKGEVNLSEVALWDGEDKSWTLPFFDCLPIAVIEEDIRSFIIDARGFLQHRESRNENVYLAKRKGKV